MMHAAVRQPAVAGVFYPGTEADLNQLVDQLLVQSTEPVSLPRQPRAFVVPHAGLVYSGPTAALVYRQIERWMPLAGWRQIVLLGPNHRVPLSGFAGVAETNWHTPLGDVAIDLDLEQSLQARFDLPVRQDAHQLEHCLEVQLPFLQKIAPEARILPLLVGHTPVETVSALIAELWQREDVLVLVSSDLSHFHPWEQARQLDAQTTRQILNLESVIEPEQACGCQALNGLLLAARKAGLELRCLGQNTSGDTAGDKARVVGYGAYACY